MSVSPGAYEHEEGAREASFAGDERRQVTSQDGFIPLPSGRTAFLVLSLIALALFALTEISIAVEHESDLLLRFDTGFEANVPTWFSSALWLTAGALALAIGGAARRAGDASGRGWLLVGGLFVLLALDETGQLHEETVGPIMSAVESTTGLSETPARLAAVAVVVVALCLLAAWLWPWLRSLPRELSLRLAVAGALFVGGSLGLEVVSRLADTPHLSPFEELFEMLGVALVVAALLPFVRGVVAQPPRRRPGERA